uniref:Hypersensitive response assisting protein n=1 Tax=Solanum tuberosum TaxID=4113 RepID=M1CMI8_SOLTU
MKNLSLLFLTHLTLFFICVCSQNIVQTQFVYKWSETYCNKDTPVGCTQIPPLKFTLNGFWGTDSNGNIQQGCRDPETRDWNKVARMTGEKLQSKSLWEILGQLF